MWNLAVFLSPLFFDFDLSSNYCPSTNSEELTNLSWFTLFLTVPTNSLCLVIIFSNRRDWATCCSKTWCSLISTTGEFYCDWLYLLYTAKPFGYVLSVWSFKHLIDQLSFCSSLPSWLVRWVCISRRVQKSNFTVHWGWLLRLLWVKWRLIGLKGLSWTSLSNFRLFLIGESCLQWQTFFICYNNSSLLSTFWR